MYRAVLVLAIVGAAATAHAEDARLAAARQAIEDTEPRRAIELAMAVAAGPASDHERAVALRIAGSAHVMLREDDAALDAYRQSFAFEPDVALESLISTPDTRSTFAQARGLWGKELVFAMQAHASAIERLGLHVDTPRDARGGRVLPLRIAFSDPAGLVARVELTYRKRGSGELALIVKPPTQPTVIEIPAEATESDTAFKLDYFVTLRHKTGFDLVHTGDATRPNALEVAPGRRPRWYDSWWARAAIGAGVIGLAGGGYLFYRSMDVGPQHVVVP